MIRRISGQWLTLIDQHKTSDLTQTAFAKQQGIDLSYFRVRKRQLLAWQQDDNHGLCCLRFTAGYNDGYFSFCDHTRF